jgi:recombination protein RecA
MKASESPWREITPIPTGIRSLDKITGIGGIPMRKITEISGKNSVGKSTLCMSIVRQAQKMGMDCVWADVEWSWDDGSYAKEVGVDIDDLDLIQEEIAEMTADAIIDWAKNHRDALIIVDSIGGFHSRAEAEKSSDEKTIGVQAKLVSTFCRRIVPKLAMNNIALVAINHEFVDIMSGGTYTSGGMKFGYHKSLSISLKKKYGAKVESGSDGVKTGAVITAEIKKNKVAATIGATADLFMIPGEGFSNIADLFANLLESGEIHKDGNTYFRGETKIGVGEKKARDWVKENLAEK